MKRLLFLFLICILAVVFARTSWGEGSVGSRYNYLYVLVHSKGTNSGIFDGRKKIDQFGFGIEFSRLKQYLESEFTLEGYVYSYDLSNNELDIAHQGWELGDSNYDNPGAILGRDPVKEDDKHRTLKPNGRGLSMLEQAKEDFKVWYAAKHPPMLPKDVPESVIPKDYILITHCMGGLAARHYIYGKDQNGQRYYRNDIAKVIFISTPHLGANGVMMKDAWDAAQRDAPVIFFSNLTAAFVSSRMLGASNPLTRYFLIAACYNYALPFSNGLFTSLFGLTNTPAFRDLEPGSSALAELNSVSPNQEYNALYPLPSEEAAYENASGRIIYGNGVCAPSSSTVQDVKLQRAIPALGMALYLINTLGVSGGAGGDIDPSSTVEGRLLGLLLSTMSGYPILADGDIFTDVRSVNADWVETLKGAKKFPYTFHSSSLLVLESDLAVMAAALGIIPGLPEELKVPILLGGTLIGLTMLATSQDLKEMVAAHGKILDRVTQKSMKYEIGYDELTEIPAGRWVVDEDSNPKLAQALFDLPEAGDDHCPGEKDFKLLSDYSSTEGKNTGVYHEVKIESYNESGSASGNLGVSIVIDGKRKLIESVMVKEPPTQVEGVLRDFMPRRMQYFQYSENFAAWKDVNVLNDYGHFVIDGLKLAEGQNVIAFRAKNKVGYTSNQIFKIVLNTIPLLPSQFKPMPNYYISDAIPNISVEFNKSEYTGDYDSEKITIREMAIDGITVEPQVESRMESYHPWAKASYKIPSDKPLPEGEHTVVAKAESNVGVAQGIWSFYVDRSPPAISMEALPPYSARSPTTIRFNVSDEVSPNLLAVRCDLYDLNDNLVTTIATAESLSKGENFFTWDGRLATDDSRLVTDGNYKVKIKAFDLAGNQTVAEQPITIDSTPPVVAGIDVTPNPMTSKTSELGLSARVNEKSTIIIKLNNTTNNSTTAYLTQASTPLPLVPSEAEGLGEGTGVRAFGASYTWKYGDMFSKGPEDGIYRVEVIARDEAGNESRPRTLEAVRIDRTPPNIYGQIANPYVLSNIGKSAYQTTLSYSLSDASNVKIKVYNSNTGQCVQTIYPDISSTSVNNVPWNGGDPSFGKGAYKFQIIAEDDVGNVGTAYASCVKDGIAPVISFPAEDNADVAGTIAIRGTAIDPDWTNDKPFKDYRVYYSKGNNPIPASFNSLGEGWETTFIEVPQVNRNPLDPKNVSVRPLQNNSTLAYLYTNTLENGDYTVLVVVDEEGGESLAAARIIKVNNDSMAASSVQVPYIKLKSLPSAVEFKSDGSTKLPIGFINSVKPANVYVEILEPRRSVAGSTLESGEKPIFFKYFPNILGAPFIGEPKYNPGSDLGYFIWNDDNGYHIRWSADGSNHKFTGSVIAIGGTFDSPSPFGRGGEGVRVSGNLISWDNTISAGEGGIDFKVGSGQLMITPKIDEDPSNPSIYADNVYLGVSKFSQQYLPIMIDVSGQRLVDMASMGKPAESSNFERSTQSIEWNGKYDTGAYVDNGTYIVRVRAEGADGVGVATDEAMVGITTPFDLTIKEVSPANREFSSLSAPDRISVYYNISKDSAVSANVFDSSGNCISKLIQNEEVLGTTNPNNPLSIIWRGNYPDPDSGLVVNGGRYKIVLNVAAKDGSASRSETIDNISVVSFTQDASVANLDPIGEEAEFHNGYGLERIRLAAGDSPYYFEAKGTGKYHPPKDFNYTLTATGKQKITAYPYVPFAGLMHRGFKQVDTKVKVRFKLHAWNWEQGKEEVYARVFGCELKWWNPLAWDRRYKEWEEERWVDGVTLREGNESKTLTFKFDTNDYWHQNDWDTFQAKANPGSGIDSIDVKAEVYTKDGSFNLDITPPSKWINPSSSETTTKGIFNITNSGKQYTTHHGTSKTGGYFVDISYGAYQVDFALQLEAPIAYSRLTNRFVPWVGFVNYKNPESKDFTEYLTDINRGLGFPGKKFFEDPEAKPDKPYKPTEEVVAELQGISNWKDRMTKIKEMANQANLLGYKDSLASTVGYDSYLSGEYIEFIPITKPVGIDGQSREFEKINDAKYKAATDLVLEPDENPISPIREDWPLYKTKIALEREYSNNKNVGDWRKDLSAWTGYSEKGQTYFEIDEAEYSSRLAQNQNSKSFSESGQPLKYDKSKGVSWWQSTQSIGQLFPVPDFVKEDINYVVTSRTESVNVSLTSSDKGGLVYAEDKDKQGVDWTTANDANLLSSDGLIRSGQLIFNSTDFKGKRTLHISSGKEEEGLKRNGSFAYPLNDRDYTSGNALKYTFLTYDPFGRDSINTPIDNPNVVITDWQVAVKDKTGGQNRDLSLEKVTLNGKRLDDTFTLKLKLDASEARYVEILGSASGPYELMYFDGSKWKTICESPEGRTGRLAWWNVSRLNGKYTVLLKSGSYIATKDISVGTLVKKEGGDTYSTYKRAQLKFPGGAFVNGSKLPQDQIVTITPVAINEIYVRNRPIIITSGPIVEIKPSPWKFTVSSIEGVDQRPTLKFVYTFDDLEELNAWEKGKPIPSTGRVKEELMLPWNIHQVTAAGDLQIISNNWQEVENNNGEYQYAFHAPLDHFSTYALLNGKFKLSAPIVFADRYITNKDTATVYGTAEPGSVLTLYLKSENVPPEVEKSEPYFARISAEVATGNYKFENVGPLREGENYIFVTSHLGDEKGIRTYSDVTIVKDTIPPSAEAKPNLYAFSPNSDSKYDSVDFVLKSNEKGKLCLQLTANGSPLFNQEISVEAEKDIKLTWTKDGFDLYRRDLASGNWLLVAGFPLSEKLSDGSYNWTVYAIDEAGNISNNIIGQTVIDTTPPIVLGLNAYPNPFTPNDDGVKDTTKYWYKFSEPAYTTLSIYRDDGKLFRRRESPTENFTYATLPPSPSLIKRGGEEGVSSSGDWVWDGRGSRNELLGGTYTWSILAEDWVGNSISSEVKQVVVDREPTLIPYAYAEPDPFAPVNPSNSFTEVKYYLSRDNLNVSVAVIGEGERPIKTLINNEVQGKGEHSARWYGDFNADYEGPTAQKNKYRVFDGSYEFQVKAVDPDSLKPAAVTNTVLVDNVPPAITTRPVRVDYGKKQASLKYVLPENSSIEVKVFDLDESLVSTIITSESQKAGEYTIVYEEPRSSFAGSSYFLLRAVDRALNETEVTTEAFAVVPNSFRIASHQAVPATFTPNGDGLIDITRITYNISGGVPDYRVAIKIANPIGSTVKTLVENDPQSSGIYSFYWDGKMDSGQLAADGYYEYVITAEDKLGTKVEERGTILLISARPAVDISTSLPIFSPNGDGSRDTVVFNYSINYSTMYITGEALVKLEVLNASGEAVWSKVFNKTAGSYVYEYDGTSPLPLGERAGVRALPAGNYYVRASAEDALGSTAVPKTVSLQVDYAEPTVAIQSISPNPFSPYVNSNKDQTVISYTLAKGAYVTIKVKQGETVVRTLRSDQWTEAYVSTSGLSASTAKAFGIPTLTWDGKTDDGRWMMDGTYTIEISAIDPAGNPHSVAQNVEVDNTLPIVPTVNTLPANTNQGLQNVTGTAEPNSKVEIYVNDNLTNSGNAAADGSFNIPINLYAGTNNIKARSEDSAGNITDFSAIQSVIYETDAPIISNLSVSPNPAKAGPATIQFTVSETLESDPVVRVNTETATFSRRFPNSTSWQYEYIYTVANSDRQGSANISIEAADFAHNFTIYQSNNLLKIDTVNAVISNVDIDVETNPRGTSQTAYAKLGSKVAIDFSVSEELLADPAVTVGSKTVTRESKTVYSSTRIDYSYSYSVTDTDPDGVTTVSIEATDLAGNTFLTLFANSLIVDKTTPEVSDLSVSPNPASIPSVSGQVSIKFDVSEPLKEAPKVYVAQNGALPSLAYGSQLTANSYEYKYDAVSGYDGPALITIEVTDLAENIFVDSFSDSLIVDTDKPTFSVIRSEIGSNPEFTKFAKEGAEVSIRFNASENLKFNPEIKVNGNPANYDSLNLGEYTYKYTVTSTDTNGNAALSIAGYDIAGNEGTAETCSSSESFVIDLITPTVEVGKRQDNPTVDLIAEPQMFATNADPTGAHGEHLSTTLHYRLVEDSKVTLSIHKIPNDQPTPTRKEDYNEDNKIVTLINGLWQTKGQQAISWDGRISGNTYASPGKYAFIVKAQDYAGNTTMIKYGGTFWIQDNVLKMRQPDQLEFESEGIQVSGNPDPLFISPFGNSTELKQKRARLYFRIDLGVTPKTTWPSEWITAMGAEDDISWEAAALKVVGTYQVKIYSEAGGLVWSSSTREAESGRILWVDWGGTNGVGQRVDDGRYKMVVEVKDFRGQPVYENTLGEKWVTVDNEKPTVSNLSTGPYYFAPGPATNSSIKTTTLTYEVSDNNNRALVSIDVYRDTNGNAQVDEGIDQYVVKLVDRGTKEATYPAGSRYDLTWAPTNVGTVYSSGFNDGKYLFKVSAMDEAGNSSNVGSKEVAVDTINPTFGANPSSRDWAKGNISVTASVSGGLSGVKTAQYAWANNVTSPVSGWNNLLDGINVNQTGDGTWYLHFKATDNAGNSSSTYFGEYLKDNTSPEVNASPTSRGWATGDISVSIYASDAHSWVTDSKYVWADSATAPSDGWVSYSSGNVITQNNQGEWYLHLRATDRAGNNGYKCFSPFKKDTTYPTVTFEGQAAATPDNPNWYSANNAITISLSDNLSYRGYKWSWDSWPSDDPGGCNTGTSDTTYHSQQGSRTLYVRVWDWAGNRTDASSTYNRDYTLPSISVGQLPASFNLYNGPFNFNCPGSDSGGSGLSSLTVGIYSSWGDLVKSFGDVRSGSWNGTNDEGNYVYVGDYNIKFKATDGAMNTTEESRPIRFTIYKEVSAGPYETREYMTIFGIRIGWRELQPGGVNSANFYVFGGCLNGISYEWKANDVYSENGPFKARFEIRRASDNVVEASWEVQDTGNTSTYGILTGCVHYLPEGTYYFHIGNTDNSSMGDAYGKVWMDGHTVHAFSVKAQPVTTQSATLELPTLIAPEKDKQDVNNIRPTFEWKHHKGSAIEYKWELAENSDFTIGRKDPVIKYPSQGSENPKEPGVLYFTYPIHEFDPGLDRDTYYWKVTALTTNEAATSEVWSFKIQPDLTLSGITNYPNPFNPNRERTKIRYRLSTDASEVKIRIYDITGSLVTELDGTTNGEGSSIWNKYNDVDWNGRNGRGDMVMNGIYPFEIVARLGDKSVSGRGKIAVLK